MQSELERVERELKIRNYSPKTLKSYLYGLREYFGYKKENPETLDQDSIRNFLLSCEQKGVSPQSRNLFLNAIKFYYQEVIKTPDKLQIRTAKKPQALPAVLSREEIEIILNSVTNAKHKLLLSLAYGSGLRVSEVVNLKVKDVNIAELTILIRQSKGQKDRLSVLSKKTARDIGILIALKKPEEHVFESERGGKLTTRTAQKIFEIAIEKKRHQKIRHFSQPTPQLRHSPSRKRSRCPLRSRTPRSPKYPHHANLHSCHQSCYKKHCQPFLILRIDQIMKIAIISDSHDNLVNLEKCLLYCENENVDILFHCGDWCAPSTLKFTRELFSEKIYGVFGNVHGEDEEMFEKAKEFDINLKKDKNEITIDKIRMTIVHRPKEAHKLAQTKKFDLIFYGHTHEPWQDKVGATYLVNPGNLAGMFTRATFAMYDTETKKT